ncbi:oligosaccharide flippase family protein [Paenibacillus sp. USHLN196]|uniref:oligosaccharide flippase family protein n=1 Tax=Paenibacillus sp. USHLN196 TaxID=3081291 RepID=UPI00301A6FEC
MKTKLRLLNNRVINGGIWTFIGRSVFAFSALVTNGLLSRLLNTMDFGTYMLAFSISFFGNIVGILGINQSIIRFTTENLQRKRYFQMKRAVHASLCIALAGAIGTVILYVLFQHFVLSRFMNSSQLDNIALLTGLWILANVIQQFIGETFRGLHEIKYASLFGGVLSNILYITCLITMMIIGSGQLDLSTVILTVSLSLLLNCILGGWILRKKLKSFPNHDQGTVLTTDKVKSSVIFRVSYPIMLSNVAIFFLTSTDLWILGVFQSEDQVAIYGAAVRLIATINFFGVLLNLVLSTHISEKYASGQLNELEKTGKLVTFIVTLPAIFLVLVFMFLGEEILGVFFGSYYSKAEPILIVLSIGQVINLLVGPSGLILTLTGNERMMLKISLFTSCITITGACIAAKLAGPVEVAIVMVAGLVLQNAILLYATKKKLGIMIFFNPLLMWKYSRSGIRLVRFWFKKKSRETILNE